MREIRIWLKITRVHLFTHIGTVVCSVLAISSLLISPSGTLWMKTARLWSRWVMFVSGVSMDVEGRSKVDMTKPFIVMSNHVSNMDIPCLFLTFPVNVSFLTKHTLARVPFFGWALKAAGFVFIDRTNAERSRESIDEAALKIQSGQKIIIFPEGTRSADGKLHPFKKGGFVLAAKTGVPIIPVFLQGAFEAMPKGTLETQSSKVVARIGDPIDTTGYSLETKDALLEEVYGAISSLMETS